MSGRRLLSRVRLDLLWALLGFAVLQLVLAVLVEHCLPDVRDPEWTAKLSRLRARRAEQPNATLVLMLGSSRASMGFRAADLGKDVLACNAALSGAGPLLELICLRRLLAAGIRPDLLLVEVVPYHFNQPAERTLEELTLNGSRLRQSEVRFSRPYLDGSDRVSRQWWKARLLPGVLQRAELRNHLALDTFEPWANSDDGLRFMDAHGWHPRFLEADPQPQRAAHEQAQAKYTEYCRTFRRAERPAQALADLLAICRQEGIAVRLVLMPEDTTFRELPSPEARAGTEQLLAEISRTGHAPVIDARAWVRDEDFWDGHHLLPAGATEFTRRLGEMLLFPFPPGKLRPPLSP
jgi:hypothetical protein